MPCLFTCFIQLLKPKLKRQFSVEKKRKKSDEAVNYSHQRQLNFANSNRKLHNVSCVFTNSVQTQHVFSPDCMVDRFCSIVNCTLYGEISKILDILNIVSGCLHVDNKFLLINFDIESKSFSSHLRPLLSPKKSAIEWYPYILRILFS